MTEERKKIKIFQKHFAWINTNFLYKFEDETGIISIIPFARESVYTDFGFYLNTKADISYLESILKVHNYKNKAEWLCEKMRKKMNEKQKED